MFLAVDDQGSFVEPMPGAKGLCPCCGSNVQSKCGMINIWHWAHLSKDCDPWSEPESYWHRQWKWEAPESCREISVENHRADIKLKDGMVVELQNSSISPAAIKDRELFYGDMIWVFNAGNQSDRMSIKGKKWMDTDPIWKGTGHLIKSDSLEFSLKDLFFDKDLYIETISRINDFESFPSRHKEGRAQLRRIFDSELEKHKKDVATHGPVEGWFFLQGVELNDLAQPPWERNIFKSGTWMESPAIGCKEVGQHISGMEYRPIDLVWKNKKKSWLTTSKPIFLDIGSPFILIGRTSAVGFYIVSKKEFVRRLNRGSFSDII